MMTYRVNAERLNASLRSFLERVEQFTGTVAAQEAVQIGEGHTADGIADACPKAEPEADGSKGLAASHGGGGSAAALGDAEARLLRGLREDIVRAIRDGVLGSAEPALLVRLLPALLTFVDAGRHVTLSYDEVRTHAVASWWVHASSGNSPIACDNPLRVELAAEQLRLGA
jgi:hypothetical protein